MTSAHDERALHHVVVLGGGFGGLTVTRTLRRAPCRITLVDRENFHLFQPLLYQVATGGLAPADIAAPLRWVLRRQRNVQVILGEVDDIDVAAKTVGIAGKQLEYDTLIVATGARHHYFGHPEWERLAPGLKSITDAAEMRRRILSAFERAELDDDPTRQAAALTFVVVGGGPTGVELAGAIAELARDTLRRDFRNFDPSDARILLVEGEQRVLGTFPEPLSARAKDALESLGVEVRLNTRVTSVTEAGVTLDVDGSELEIEAETVLWGAGVAGSPLGATLAEQTRSILTRSGQVEVGPDFSLNGQPDVRVIGDLASMRDSEGTTLPGVAPAAMQAGRFVARDLEAQWRGRRRREFRYRDKGNLATIGRRRAVADFGRFRFAGLFAWLTWLGVHIAFLIGFANRVIVLFKWAIAYFTFNRGSRLILPSRTQTQRVQPKPSGRSGQ